jgi:hypothetical protein
MWLVRVHNQHWTPMAHYHIDTDEVIRFARELEGHELRTLAHGRPFRIHVTEKGLVYIPGSTCRPRRHHHKWLKRVCEEFSRTNSFTAKHYHHLSKNASYALAVIQRYLTRAAAAASPTQAC